MHIYALTFWTYFYNLKIDNEGVNFPSAEINAFFFDFFGNDAFFRRHCRFFKGGERNAKQ